MYLLWFVVTSWLAFLHSFCWLAPYTDEILDVDTSKGNAEMPRTGGKRKCREAKKWWQKEMQCVRACVCMCVCVCVCVCGVCFCESLSMPLHATSIDLPLDVQIRRQSATYDARFQHTACMPQCFSGLLLQQVYSALDDKSNYSTINPLRSVITS